MSSISRTLTRIDALEQQKNYYENRAKKCARVAKYCLDPDNKKTWSARAKANNKKAAEIAEKLSETVDYSGESGIIYSRNSFRSDTDPMFEITGSAYDSNPDEVKKILSQLNEWGVEVNQSSKSLSYGCLRIGEPGRMSITKNASYSAWLHEYQHVIDDHDAGWDGLYVLWNNPDERIRREQRAYGVEIQLAESYHKKEIVKRLEASLNAEINRIWNDFNKYRKYL